MATPTPKKRASAKRSAPAPSSNKKVPSSQSAKKACKKTTAEVFKDGEDVQVAENYSVKKWRGKSGFVELSSSTDSKVMVTFPDGSCNLIANLLSPCATKQPCGATSTSKVGRRYSILLRGRNSIIPLQDTPNDCTIINGGRITTRMLLAN